MALSAYNEIIIVSLADDHDSILGLIQNIHSVDHSTEFTFLNIYKELPIISSGTIVEIKEKHAEFSVNSTQFAAMHEAGEVLDVDEARARLRDNPAEAGHAPGAGHARATRHPRRAPGAWRPPTGRHPRFSSLSAHRGAT